MLVGNIIWKDVEVKLLCKYKEFLYLWRWVSSKVEKINKLKSHTIGMYEEIEGQRKCAVASSQMDGPVTDQQ